MSAPRHATRRPRAASLLVALVVAAGASAPVGRAAEAPAPHVRAAEVSAPPLARAADTPLRSRVLEVGARERLLVVAPHPDDEVLGAGGLVQRVLARGGTVDVVLVTAGDGYPDAVRGATGLAVPAASDYVAYGARRLAEARAALDALGGADRVHATVLGFPDGVLPALRGAHWSAADPARSPTTDAVAPPYDGLVADDAVPYAGEALLDALTRLVRRVRPTLVALPDPLDVHGDHATTGLFALAALAEARSDARIVAYLVHWPAWPPGWDATASAAPRDAAGLALPVDLPPRDGRVALVLSSAELAVKRRALARHATQQRQMAGYLDAFLRPREPYSLLARGDTVAAQATLRAAPAAR